MIDTLNNKYMKEMCKFAVMDGKRLRPIIGYSILNSTNLQKNEDIKYIISGIELLHNASLIIDDIMDGDIYRRGKKTVCAVYGNNMAQLISAELIRLFYKSVINMSYKLNANHEKILCNTFDSNFEKLISGQYYDLVNIKNDKTTKIIDQKTGSLFEMIFVSSWILSNPKNINDVDKVKEIAIHFGIMYQIYDDFTDYYNDKYNDKYNYVIIVGIQEGNNIFMNNYNAFYDLAEKINILSEELKIIISYLKTCVVEIYQYIDKKIEI